MTLADIAPVQSLNAETKRIEGEHALIFGLTGFGKSYLVKRLASFRKYIAVHDPKGTFKLPGARRYTSLKKAMKSEAPWVIYSPDRTELRDERAQNAFFEWVYQRENTTTIVDELTAIATSRHDIPDSLFDCYARGRERGIEVWALTQEPVWIPSIVKTQARHRYTFYIAGLGHQKTVCEIMPGLTPQRILDLEKRRFHYYREGERLVDPRGPFVIKPGDTVT